MTIPDTTTHEPYDTHEPASQNNKSPEDRSSSSSPGESGTQVEHSKQQDEGSAQSPSPPIPTNTVSPNHATGDSIYTPHEKWIIVTIIAIGGFFSPLTANVYLPAIPAVANAFHKSVSLINLSVTVYMVFQGIAPMFWGTLADYKGRRPIYLMCLLVLSLSCVGLALTPTNAYWLLMLLRALQAAGSASTIALGAGVIGDITRPEERGGMFGLFSIGPVIGPAVAPVIGGVISQNLGWRAIFWFVCIASGVCLVFLVLFLPETLRAIVGDGSIVPPKLYRPIIPLIGRGRHTSPQTQTKPPPKPFTNPLILLTYPDVLLLLLTNGIATGVFYSIATSLSSLFPEAYPFLDEAKIGYCYLANGGGMAIGTGVTGRVLDREYGRMKRRYLAKMKEDRVKNGNGNGVEGDVGDIEKLDPRKIIDFPIEKARLSTLPYMFFLFVASCAGYGWCVQERVNLAGPLILQIILGFGSIWILNSTQCLLIDLVPDRGSSVTACNNLIRCTTGAIMVSIIEPILRGIGVGWAFVLFAGLSLIGGLMTAAVVEIGPRCRKGRMRRKEREEEKRALKGEKEKR